MNQVHQASDSLELVSKVLRSDWHQVKAEWRDQVGDAFEEEQFSPLYDQTSRTIKRLAALDVAVSAARRSIR